VTEATAGRRALVFIFITVLVDTIGFGIIIPVTPELIMELTGEGLGRAAIYGGYAWIMQSTPPEAPARSEGGA
jgi:DHA1 family tetracycline resistance protein-like MFS transporter